MDNMATTELYNFLCVNLFKTDAAVFGLRIRLRIVVSLNPLDFLAELSGW